jgi:hypothetical protein
VFPRTGPERAPFLRSCCGAETRSWLFCCLCDLCRDDRGCSISVVAALRGLGDRGLISCGAVVLGFFSLRRRFQAGSGAHSTSCSVGVGGAAAGAWG